MRIERRGNRRGKQTKKKERNCLKERRIKKTSEK